MTRTMFAAVAICMSGMTAPFEIGAQSTTSTTSTTSATSATSAAGTAAAPTYSRDVAPILYRNCTTCHRPGEIGPMPLLSYQDARPWAQSIATRVAAGTMPPWHADPSTGEFSNDRRLSAAEKDTIVGWVAGGAFEGDPRDLPAPPRYEIGRAHV